MKALLLIAHGSRVTESNQEIETLIEKLRLIQSGYDMIEFAFLEMASPTIMEAGEGLVMAGATEIKVLPYFLVAGNHVIRDVPEEIASLSARFPAAQFTIAPYFGSAEGIVELMCEQI